MLSFLFIASVNAVIFITTNNQFVDLQCFNFKGNFHFGLNKGLKTAFLSQLQQAQNFQQTIQLTQISRTHYIFDENLCIATNSDELKIERTINNLIMIGQIAQVIIINSSDIYQFFNTPQFQILSLFKVLEEMKITERQLYAVFPKMKQINSDIIFKYELVDQNVTINDNLHFIRYFNISVFQLNDNKLEFYTNIEIQQDIDFSLVINTQGFIFYFNKITVKQIILKDIDTVNRKQFKDLLQIGSEAYKSFANQMLCRNTIYFPQIKDIQINDSSIYIIQNL
ncbi:hypothetical protein pb186bvf_013387 [Paramecium bursaria]